jgi:uncharacterized phage-associated protein
MLSTLLTTFRQRQRRNSAPSAIATANAIILELRDLGIVANATRIQRLAILAQGWSLLLHEEPMYCDPTIVYGDTPAIAAVHAGLRRFGVAPVDALIAHPDLPSFDHPADDDERRLEVLRQVVRSYGRFDSYQLGRILRDALPKLENGGTVQTHLLRSAFQDMTVEAAPIS